MAGERRMVVILETCDWAAQTDQQKVQDLIAKFIDDNADIIGHNVVGILLPVERTCEEHMNKDCTLPLHQLLQKAAVSLNAHFSDLPAAPNGWVYSYEYRPCQNGEFWLCDSEYAVAGPRSAPSYILTVASKTDARVELNAYRNRERLAQDDDPISFEEEFGTNTSE